MGPSYTGARAHVDQLPPALYYASGGSDSSQDYNRQKCRPSQKTQETKSKHEEIGAFQLEGPVVHQKGLGVIIISKVYRFPRLNTGRRFPRPDVGRSPIDGFTAAGQPTPQKASIKLHLIPDWISRQPFQSVLVGGRRSVRAIAVIVES